MEISRGNATSAEKTICTGSKIFTFLLVKCMLLCKTICTSKAIKKQYALFVLCTTVNHLIRAGSQIIIPNFLNI